MKFDPFWLIFGIWNIFMTGTFLFLAFKLKEPILLSLVVMKCILAGVSIDLYINEKMKGGQNEIKKSTDRSSRDT